MRAKATVTRKPTTLILVETFDFSISTFETEVVVNGARTTLTNIMAKRNIVREPCGPASPPPSSISLRHFTVSRDRNRIGGREDMPLKRPALELLHKHRHLELTANRSPRALSPGWQGLFRYCSIRGNLQRERRSIKPLKYDSSRRYPGVVVPCRRGPARRRRNCRARGGLFSGHTLPSKRCGASQQPPRKQQTNPNWSAWTVQSLAAKIEHVHDQLGRNRLQAKPRTHLIPSGLTL